ncbi:flavin reductase [Acinetobacter baumannii]
MMGFHMMMQHDPPWVGAVIGPWDYSHQALSKTGECVLAVSTVDLAETMMKTLLEY